MNLMQICKNSIPVRKNPEFSKIWPCRIFNEWERTADLGAFTQQKLPKSQKKLTVPMRMDSVHIASQCLKQWVVSIITVLSRGRTCCDLRRPSTWKKKETNRWIAETVFWGEMFHCCRNFGLWVVESQQTWCDCNRRLKKIILMQVSLESKPVIGQDKIRRIVWLRTVWQKNSRTSEIKISELPPLSKKKQTYVDKILVHEGRSVPRRKI